MSTAVVVGAGPNGLTAGALLAREGVQVTVFEAADEIGGGTRSAEGILPGLLHDHCSAIHPMAVSRRRERVSSVFAPVIHSTYSFLFVKLKESNVAIAFLFPRRAPMRSSGITSTRFSVLRFFAGTLIPLAFRAAAFFTSATTALSPGSSDSDVMRPSRPIAVTSGPPAPVSSDSFQKPKTQ